MCDERKALGECVEHAGVDRRAMADRRVWPVGVGKAE